MNGKRYFLVIRKKWKSLILFLAVGALLGAGIYAIYFANLTKTKLYQSEAVFYITANEASAYNYFNDYTWKQVITDDPILTTCMEYLTPISSVSFTREELEKAVEAGIVSDLRIVIVTVTMDSELSVNQATQGIIAGMEAFSEDVPEFDEIKCWSFKPARPVEYENLILHAVVLGLVLSLILWAIVITVYYAVEDSIYTISDVKEITKIPILGIRTKKGNATLEKMLAANLEALGNEEEILEISVDDENVWDIHRMMDKKVVISVRYGNHNGRKMELLLQHLSTNNITPAGVVIADADNVFLKAYYNL